MPHRSEGPSEEELARRFQWFQRYTHTTANHSVHRSERGEPYACPCCGYLTLDSRGTYEICAVCFWEDDGQDNHDADIVRGGPNYSLSLSQARSNFDQYGACEERHIYHVRPPEPEELPSDGTGRPLPPEARRKRLRRRLP